jgi:two-component system sensor histidine kinase HydH
VKFPNLPIHSLRAKLLLFSLSLVVVPGTVLALIAFAGAHRALESAVGRQLAEVADDAADAVAETLAAESKNMRTWARQDLMREVVIGDLDKRISRFLASLKDGDGRYLDLLCADANGQIVAASNPTLIGGVQRDREWFSGARQGKEILRGPAVSFEYGRPALEIAAPIYDPERPGTIIGALLGLYDWERSPKLTERLQHNLAGLGMTVDLLILDAHGVVIAAPQQGQFSELFGQNLRKAGWLAAQRHRQLPRRGYVVEPTAAVLVGFARLKGKPLPRWSALATQPLREALAPVYRMQQRLALLLGAVLLGGLGVATLLADRMSRPLRELTDATQEIVRVGQIRKPVAVRSQDEIGQLALAFNTMMRELQRAEEDLLVAAKFAFVGEVAAGVAHEVRTPLGIMRSSAQLVGRSLPPTDVQAAELIETIIDEVDRLDRVVAGLLQLARPHEALIEPTPLAPVLQRALEFAEAQARDKSIVIDHSWAPDQHPASCDPEQIYQVALNLIVNALQILPPGGRISVRTLPPYDGRVAFEVSDNGPGIPPDLRERIFAPFFTMREGGTGLGLALVQRVVQAHKGTVSVDSTVGRGTTFRVELPTAGVSA